MTDRRSGENCLFKMFSCVHLFTFCKAGWLCRFYRTGRDVISNAAFMVADGGIFFVTS